MSWYRAWEKPLGAYLVAPGLHPAGPSDPRFDRFCRVLAGAGFVVAAPHLRPLAALRVAPASTVELTEAFLELRRRHPELPRPAIFSISFGSLPAIELAASDAHRNDIGALVLFGGYADFSETVRFAAGAPSPKAGPIARDPLNLPAVFLNLLDQLDLGEHVSALEKAFHEMVVRTWGKPELKLQGARDSIADEIASSLPEEIRAMFLLGCGLAGEPLPVVERALAAKNEPFRFADARPHLARVRANVVIVHGRQDDVIPWTEAQKLKDALPADHPVSLHLTGFYGHTAGERPHLSAMATEVKTLLALVRALALAPLDRWRNTPRHALTRARRAFHPR